MKMLLGVMVLSVGALSANPEHMARMEAELKHKIHERDRLNEEIAKLSEEHARAHSDHRVREMQPKKRTVASDRAKGKY